MTPDTALHVKQEEDESSTGLTPLSKNGASYTTNGHSHNATEDVKMQDVVSGLCLGYNSIFSEANPLATEPRRQNSGSISEFTVPTSASPSATPPIGSLSSSLAPSSAD